MSPTPKPFRGRLRVIRPIQEDCIGFHPDRIEVKRVSGRWKIVEGSHWILDFENLEAEARLAFSIIKHYRMDQICFVGRPDPSMTYFLSRRRAPKGPFPGEDAIAFNPKKIEVKQISGRWKIVEGSHWIMDFETNAGEAREAFQIIKKYGFKYICFVGRPDPSLTYFRK
ncbi:MAG: hypothetical protein ACFFCO_10280 [Promethearchaeota archaeon]